MAALSARRLLKIGAGFVALGVAWIAAASLLVERADRGRIWSDPAAIPARRVGLVLGCARVLGGYHNPFFDSRIGVAARLFRAGKVEYLIVSGGNHVRGYGEPKDVKDGLIRAGVPPERVVCDYAGFRTLDSIVRAREVFGQTAITVVSQEFHNQRAIFIARHRGVDAIGFNAPEADAYDSFRIECRERAEFTARDSSGATALREARFELE